MGKQCWSQAVLELGSSGHSVLQTPALVSKLIRSLIDCVRSSFKEFIKL